LNPYESGSAPAVEVVERQPWTSVATAVLAALAACSCAVVFGYVIHTLDRFKKGFTPDAAVMAGGFSVWGLCSLLGVVFGATALVRRRGKRGFTLFCFLVNLLLLISLTGLWVIGRVAGSST
jgi:hypothetical protein